MASQQPYDNNNNNNYNNYNSYNYDDPKKNDTEPEIVATVMASEVTPQQQDYQQQQQQQQPPVPPGHNRFYCCKCHTPYDLPDKATSWRCPNCMEFNSTTPGECPCCTVM